VLSAPLPVPVPVLYRVQVGQVGRKLDVKLLIFLSWIRRWQAQRLGCPAGEGAERGSVDPVVRPDPERAHDHVVADRPYRRAPVPLDRRLLQLQQMRQARARGGPGAPRQFLGWVVEHERHLHRIKLVRPIKHMTERVSANQRRCLVPQAADPLAPLGDHLQPLHRSAVTHDPILSRVRVPCGAFRSARTVNASSRPTRPRPAHRHQTRGRPRNGAPPAEWTVSLMA